VLYTFLRHVDRTRLNPFVVFFQPGPLEREVAALGVGTVVLRSGRLREIGNAFSLVRSLAQLLRRMQPGLLLNWTAKAHLYGAPAASLAGIGDRCIWWQHNIPTGHWIDRLATLLPAQAIGCCSGPSASAQARCWPSRRTFVIHPGIDRPDDGSDSDERALQSELGIPSGRTVLGTVGRLQPSKGQHRFLNVLAALLRRGLDVHGLVVGGDPGNFSPGYPARLYRLADELGLRHRVTFTGHVQVAPYWRLIDIAVHAAPAEPFGLVLVEAMAAGVPVIAFDAGGPADIVESGRSGILVPAGDDGSLTDAAARLVCDPALRRRLGDGARRRAQSFSADRMARSMEHTLVAAAVGAAAFGTT
jgi:hypothetical protein